MRQISHAINPVCRFAESEGETSCAVPVIYGEKSDSVTKNLYYDDSNFISELKWAPMKHSHPLNNVGAPVLLDNKYHRTLAIQHQYLLKRGLDFISFKKQHFPKECIETTYSTDNNGSVAGPQDDSESISPRKNIESILRDVAPEDLETGAETEFSRRLSNVIRFYRESALEILNEILEGNIYNDEIRSKLIRITGLFKNEELRDKQLSVLIACLSNNSPIIRDSAALALSDLEDPTAITFLKEALSREKYAMLKEDYQQIISELEV